MNGPFSRDCYVIGDWVESIFKFIFKLFFPIIVAVAVLAIICVPVAAVKYLFFG